jgi:hypothetical protein
VGQAHTLAKQQTQVFKTLLAAMAQLDFSLPGLGLA